MLWFTATDWYIRSELIQQQNVSATHCNMETFKLYCKLTTGLDCAVLYVPANTV